MRRIFLVLFVISICACLAAHCLEKEPYEEFEYPSPDSSSEPQSPVQILTPGNKTEESFEYFKNFWEWKAICLESIKANRSPLTKELFIEEMYAFTAHFKNSNIIHAPNWIETPDYEPVMPSMKFLLNHSFEPYVTKLEVSPEEKTVFIGDVHGDIESFNHFLESLAVQGITDPEDPFKLIDQNAYVVFLGDYTDRGRWGLEVLYALSRFVRVNWRHGKIQRVFGLRGNHEDPFINFSMPGNNLYVELRDKFHDLKVIDLIEKFYNCLPLALIIKSDAYAFLACHGGLDPGFRDMPAVLNSTGKLRYMLINGLYRKEMLSKLPPAFNRAFKQLKEKGEFRDFTPNALQDAGLIPFGFLWIDYEFKSNPSSFAPIEFKEGRGMKLPERVTKALFELNSTPTCKLIGNIRGHQHGPDTMERILNKDDYSDPEEAGLSKIWLPYGKPQPVQKLWPGIVCTLCVCPNTSYGHIMGIILAPIAFLMLPNNLMIGSSRCTISKVRYKN